MVHVSNAADRLKSMKTDEWDEALAARSDSVSGTQLSEPS